MKTSKTFSAIAQQISDTTKTLFEIKMTKSISGGDINAAFLLEGENARYFVKLNQADLVEMFAAEFTGLTELAKTKTVRIPRPITFGQTDKNSFLVLVFLELKRATMQSETAFGQQLAQLHLQKQPFFGWQIDNTIGSTRQPNARSENWVHFWREQRLGFQLQLAAQKGYGGKLQTLGEKLCERLDDFFTDYTPQPSLLHGDLWGGNFAMDSENNPVMFDPACYYGDRETDLAMTELFGGFGQNFYAAYNEVWRLDSGYKTRKTLYNLYHILNHVNLFGGGYASQAENMMQKLLAE
jgi:protein-ribulosamine 3-kinase